MGAPKATLPFGPETMLQRVVRLLATVVSPIVVVAANGQALPALPDEVTVTRDEREARGPLEGLRAGLKALPESVEAAYVTSCDVPLLVPAFVERMIELMGDHDIAVMEVDGFPHPALGRLPARHAPHVESLLANDRLRPVFLFDAVRTRRRAAGGNDRRRSGAQDAAEPQYARGLPGGARDGTNRQQLLTGQLVAPCSHVVAANLVQGMATSERTIFLRHTSSKSVLSIGLATSLAAAAAAAIASSVSVFAREERRRSIRFERS